MSYESLITSIRYKLVNNNGIGYSHEYCDIETDGSLKMSTSLSRNYTFKDSARYTPNLMWAEWNVVFSLDQKYGIRLLGQDISLYDKFMFHNLFLVFIICIPLPNIIAAIGKWLMTMIFISFVLPIGLLNRCSMIACSKKIPWFAKDSSFQQEVFGKYII